jgi:hypothetical protein
VLGWSGRMPEEIVGVTWQMGEYKWKP